MPRAMNLTEPPPDGTQPAQEPSKGLGTRAWETYQDTKRKIVEGLTPEPTPIPFVKPPASDERDKEVAARFRRTRQAGTEKNLNALMSVAGIPVTFETVEAGVEAHAPRPTPPEVEIARSRVMEAVSPGANLDKPPYGVLATENIKIKDWTVPSRQIDALDEAAIQAGHRFLKASDARNPRVSPETLNKLHDDYDQAQRMFYDANKAWQIREPAMRAEAIKARKAADEARASAAKVTATRGQETNETLRRVPGGEFMVAEDKTRAAEALVPPAEKAAREARQSANVIETVEQTRKEIAPGRRERFLERLRSGEYDAEGAEMDMDEMFRRIGEYDRRAKILADEDAAETVRYRAEADALWRDFVKSSTLAKKLAASTIRDAKLYSAARSAGKGVLAAMKAAPGIALSAVIFSRILDSGATAATPHNLIRYTATSIQRPVELEDVESNVSRRLATNPAEVEKMWDEGVLAPSLYDNIHRVLAAKAQQDVREVKLAQSDAQWRAAGATVAPGGREIK